MILARFTRICLLAFLPAAMPATTSFAQTNTREVPDVFIIVTSGSSQYDMASFTYNSEIPKATALDDLKALTDGTGWKVSSVNVYSEAGRPGGPKMTSVDFQVDNRAVQWATGVLLVEPFAVAFKRFDLVQLTYSLQGTLPFRSLRDYTDRYVDIKFSTTNGSYSYTIRIKDHDFEKLNLPQIVTEQSPSDQRPAQTAGDNGAGSGTIIWIALLIAVAAGAVAYVISSRAARKSKGAGEPKDGT